MVYHRKGPCFEEALDIYLDQSLNHWKTFYAEHKDYKKVGRVLHEPIDPTSPVPEHCDPKKAAKYAEEAKAKAAKAAHGSNKASEHEEL